MAVVSTRSVAVSAAVNRGISSFGHQSLVASDPAAVFELLQRDDPDVLIVDATAGDGTWLDVVRAARNLTRYRYVVVVGTGGPSEMQEAYRAGADQYLRFPFEATELGVRLTAVERIMRYVRCSTATFEEGPSVVAASRAWVSLETDLTRALSETLCVDCRRVDLPFPSGSLFASRLKFSLPNPRAAVLLELMAPESSLVAMTGLLLGSTTTELPVLIDACKEVLNTLGGTFKRNSLPEHDFTTGIPEMTSLDALRRSARASQHRKSWTVGWGKHLVALQATIQCEEAQALPLHSLSEGMVLADDVRNQHGVLVAPRGMHLTENAIARLYGVLGGDASLRVTNAA